VEYGISVLRITGKSLSVRVL